MDAFWLRGTDVFRLRSQWTRIEVGKGKRVLYLNEMPVYLGFPTLYEFGRLYLSRADYEHVLQSILTPQVFEGPPDLKHIILDPGTRGKDSGAVNDRHGHTEKGLNFDVTLRLKRLLERAGYKVTLTRYEDEFVPLGVRPRIANRARGDLFSKYSFQRGREQVGRGIRDLCADATVSGVFPVSKAIQARCETLRRERF